MNQTISCTYIGHATNLIKIGGTNILTDPHFGKWTLFFPRRTPMPFPPSKLPPLAAVLLSHTHFDHLNVASYKFISCSVPIIVPEGSERAIGQFMPNPVIELSHYAEHELADGTKITAVPTEHRSSRLSHVRFTKTNSYLIRRPDMPGAVFFCADSAYGNHFREIGNLGAIEVALLPIGGYEPRFFMRRCHMTPAEAVQAFEDLNAHNMIPIHHGTFRLTMENADAPIQWLTKILEERPDLTSRIHPLKAGEEFAV
jgi:L-ascorbate metabolism protein UlaG (beta-lactamase superfamily)